MEAKTSSLPCFVCIQICVFVCVVQYDQTIIHCPGWKKVVYVCVCVCPHATTVWTDPQQYVRENTLQSAQQTTVHYCMITICLWDCGFKPGSDPAGDSRPISFHLLSLGCVLCTVHCILIRRAFFLFCFLRRGLLDPPICLWWTMTKNSLLSSLIFLLFFFGADSKASSGPLPVCSRWCQIE